MSENVVIYAGLDKQGKARKKALEREALRRTKSASVSELVWSLFREHGSERLRKDLEAADRLTK